MLPAISVFDGGERFFCYSVVDGKRKASSKTFRMPDTVKAEFLLLGGKRFSTGIAKRLFHKRYGGIADRTEGKGRGRDFLTERAADRIKDTGEKAKRGC